MFVLALRAPAFLPMFASTALFENHWAWWIAAGAVAGTLLFVGRLRANRSFQRAGAGLAILAILWLAAALVFDTPAERLHAAHREMADAAAQHDLDKILSYLAPDFSCSSLGIPIDPTLSRARSQIDDTLKQYGIKEIYITRYQSTLSDHTATTSLTFVANVEGFGPVKTSWQLYWKDLPDSDWKISTASLTAIGDQSVSSDHPFR